MIELLSRLFARHDTPEDRLVRMAIDGVVAGTDPRLRALGALAKRLHAPVLTTIHYVRGISKGLDPAIELSAAVYGADPRVHAMFGSVDSMRQTIAGDPALRSFRQAAGHFTGEEVFALLLAERRLKQVLGMDLHGDLVMRDLTKTVLVFARHRLRGVAASEAEAGRALRVLAFRQIVAAARKDIERAKSGEPIDAFDADAAAVAARLRDTGPATLTLDDYLVLVAGVLAHPERHLRIDTFSATIDRMGALLDPGDTRSDADRVTFREVRQADREAPTVALRVRLRPADFPPLQGSPELL